MSEGIQMPPACVVCGRPAPAPNPALAGDQTWGVMLPAIPSDGQKFVDPNKGVAVCLPCLQGAMRLFKAAKANQEKAPT